jgi:hypothetical protein
MAILSTTERDFLAAYLHEATTSPFFAGPASKAIQAIGVEYHDISYLAWAYEQDVPRTRFEVGFAADTTPSLPWPNREAVLRRNNEVRRFWQTINERVPQEEGSGMKVIRD